MNSNKFIRNIIKKFISDRYDILAALNLSLLKIFKLKLKIF
jgi:hypothetical protein